MMPTIAHGADPWSMGYDLYPVDTLRTKQSFAREVVARETLVFFEHDPHVAAGKIIEGDGKRRVTPIAGA